MLHCLRLEILVTLLTLKESHSGAAYVGDWKEPYDELLLIGRRDLVSNRVVVDFGTDRFRLENQ